MNIKKKFWNDDTIRFMIDASEHTAYNSTIAGIIGAKLTPDMHVCDAGCGLGYLSLELTSYVRRVTAVDISSDALNVLHNHCVLRGAENIEIRCGDIEQMMPPEPYDAMVFCMFGGSDECLCIAKAQCSGEVFMILRDERVPRAAVNTHCMGYKGYRDTCLMLDVLGIPYEKEEHAIDFGQPFRSLEDARIFFERHGLHQEAEITEEELRSRMQETGRADFPYFMPHMRHIGIIRFSTKDIPQEFAEFV